MIQKFEMVTMKIMNAFELNCSHRVKRNGKLVYKEPEKSLYPVIAKQLGSIVIQSNFRQQFGNIHKSLHLYKTIL